MCLACLDVWKLTLLGILILGIPELGHTHQAYQSNIPNGDKVSDPCENGQPWKGVGHRDPEGRGPRNPFGVDFKSSQMIRPWSELCLLDSDQDGQTNGHELGDPFCTWTKETPTPLLTNISHPGICEPMNTDQCRKVNDWLQCDRNKTFYCEGLDDNETLSIDIRFNNESVPAVETTYVCNIYPLPSDDNYDVFAAEPIVDNSRVLHHMLIFGCKGNATFNEPIYDCFTTDTTPCKELLGAFGAWERGVSEMCLRQDLGIRIGPQGYTGMLVQYHWNNVERASGMTDSSGVRLYYTPKLRMNRSGMLLIGQLYLDIPPGRREVSVSGGCVEDCSNRRMSGDVMIVGSFHHMHLLGKRQTVTVYRNGTLVKVISEEDNYDYNNPLFHRLETPFVVKPGDNLTTTCKYDTRTTNKTTTFGLGTTDEMCFAFLRFYPSENMAKGGCSTWKSVPLCKIYTKDELTVQNCNIKQFMREETGENGTMIARTISKCPIQNECSTACEKWRKNGSQHDCLRNDIGDYVKKLLDVSEEGKRFVQVLDSVCSEDPERSHASSISVISLAVLTIANLFTVIMLLNNV